MGRSFLRLSKKEFWGMTPRKLIEMIDAWKEVSKTQAFYFAMLNNGKPIPDERPEKKQEVNSGAFFAM